MDKRLKLLRLKKYKKESRYILGGLVIFWLMLVMLAPLAEFAKIIVFIFVRSADAVKMNNAVELTYFLIASFIPWWIITTNCCGCCIQTGLTPNALKQKLFILSVVWTTISVVYTHYTRDDIGDIPFSCPSDYPYPIPKLRLACIIRATNFIFMWMYTCLNIVFLLAAFSGILPTEDELKREKKELNIKTVLEGIDIEDDEIRKG